KAASSARASTSSDPSSPRSAAAPAPRDSLIKSPNSCPAAAARSSSLATPSKSPGTYTSPVGPASPVNHRPSNTSNDPPLHQHPQNLPRDLLTPHPSLHLRKAHRPLPAHPLSIPLHHPQTRPHNCRQIRLVDHQQVRLRDPRPALPRNLIAAGDINHVHRVI